MSDPAKRIAPWEDVVLRVIAIYKLTKAVLALALGLTLLKLIHHDVSLFLHDYIVDPLHLDSDADSENHALKSLFEYAASLTPHAMRLSAYASFFYALVFAIEGIGLYLKKHWAEYMVLIVTGSFLLPEGWLIYQHTTWWKVALMVGNLLIIGYLIHRLLLEARTRAAAARSEERPPMSAAPTAISKPVASEVP